MKFLDVIVDFVDKDSHVSKLNKVEEMGFIWWLMRVELIDVYVSENLCWWKKVWILSTYKSSKGVKFKCKPTQNGRLPHFTLNYPALYYNSDNVKTLVYVMYTQWRYDAYNHIIYYPYENTKSSSLLKGPMIVKFFIHN